MKVFIVEDESDIAELLEFNLQREGYETKIIVNGEEVLPAVEESPPDLILLDLMLPGIGGVEVCRRIRSIESLSSIPIIMLTARGSEADIVLGFESGADDYVVKPFSTMELMARVRALMRRLKSPHAQAESTSGKDSESDTRSVMIFGPLVICPDERWVKVEGREAILTRSEYDLLLTMVGKPNRVFKRDELLSKITGDAVVGDRTIDVHIAALRRKLGAMGSTIETIRGVGYRFKFQDGTTDAADDGTD